MLSAPFFPVVALDWIDGDCIVRPGCADGDPFDERGNLLFRELPLRRHFIGLPPHRLDEQALVRFFGHDGRPRVASGDGQCPSVQPQPAFQVLRIRTVALETVLNQQRSDFALEKLDLLGREFSRHCRTCASQQPHYCQQ
jgi:hypothetical protein